MCPGEAERSKISRADSAGVGAVADGVSPPSPGVGHLLHVPREPSVLGRSAQGRLGAELRRDQLPSDALLPFGRHFVRLRLHAEYFSLCSPSRTTAELSKAPKGNGHNISNSSSTAESPLVSGSLSSRQFNYPMHFVAANSSVHMQTKHRKQLVTQTTQQQDHPAGACPCPHNGVILKRGEREHVYLGTSDLTPVSPSPILSPDDMPSFFPTSTSSHSSKGKSSFCRSSVPAPALKRGYVSTETKGDVHAVLEADDHVLAESTILSNFYSSFSPKPAGTVAVNSSKTTVFNEAIQLWPTTDSFALSSASLPLSNKQVNLKHSLTDRPCNATFSSSRGTSSSSAVLGKRRIQSEGMLSDSVGVVTQPLSGASTTVKAFPTSPLRLTESANTTNPLANTVVTSAAADDKQSIDFVKPASSLSTDCVQRNQNASMCSAQPPFQVVACDTSSSITLPSVVSFKPSKSDRSSVYQSGFRLMDCAFDNVECSAKVLVEASVESALLTTTNSTVVAKTAFCKLPCARGYESGKPLQTPNSTDVERPRGIDVTSNGNCLVHAYPSSSSPLTAGTVSLNENNSNADSSKHPLRISISISSDFDNPSTDKPELFESNPPASPSSHMNSFSSWTAQNVPPKIPSSNEVTLSYRTSALDVSALFLSAVAQTLSAQGDRPSTIPSSQMPVSSYFATRSSSYISSPSGFSPAGGRGARGLGVRRTAGSRKQVLDMSLKTRAFKTILILSLLLCLCWIPHATAVLVTFSADQPRPIVLLMLLWVGFLKSGLNPVVYCLRIRKFRDACKEHLPRSCYSCYLGGLLPDCFVSLAYKRRVNPSAVYQCSSNGSADPSGVIANHLYS